MKNTVITCYKENSTNSTVGLELSAGFEAGDLNTALRIASSLQQPAHIDLVRKATILSDFEAPWSIYAPLTITGSTDHFWAGKDAWDTWTIMDMGMIPSLINMEKGAQITLNRVMLTNLCTMPLNLDPSRGVTINLATVIWPISHAW